MLCRTNAYKGMMFDSRLLQGLELWGLGFRVGALTV